MKKTLSVIGSTGSVGENTLNVVRIHSERFSVQALAVFKNTEKLYEQAVEFRPKVVCVYDKEKARAAEPQFRKLKIRVVTGDEGLCEVSTLRGVDQVVFALVGAVGLKPIFAAVEAKKSVAIANKEPLVMAGKLLLDLAKQKKVSVIPIDSEHSALWQCLENHSPKFVKRLVITSSGGPFRNFKGTMSKITLEQALKHPKWKMGPKITIDSATMMNKGLEVIEATNLFQVEAGRVDVLVHPEAIIHAMVEFVDGSHLAHLGVTDMKLSIQYALSYPYRLEDSLPQLDLTKLESLHFEEPNLKKFPCLELGYISSKIGGTMPAVLNAANEIAVAAFLNKKIGFLQIPAAIEKTMRAHTLVHKPNLKDILDANSWAREFAANIIR